MDKLSVIGKIGTILSDLKAQQEYFEQNLHSLNEVEVELFAASATYLAEYAKVLKKFPVNRTGTPPAAVQANPAEPLTRPSGSGVEEEFTEDTKKIHQPGASQAQKLNIREEPLTGQLLDLAEATTETRPDESAPVQDVPLASTAGEGASAGSALSESAGDRFPDPVAPASSPDASFTTGPEIRSQEIPSATPPGEESSAPGTAPAPDPELPQEAPRRISLNERFSEKRGTLYERIISQKFRPATSAPVPEQSPAPDQPQRAEQPLRFEQPAASPSPGQPEGAPIMNLGRSIGINERYYFIKTLFQNDKVAFDQAITRIDMCHSLGEALEYTNRSLAGKYNWSKKEEDARKFYDLLKRRFI